VSSETGQFKGVHPEFLFNQTYMAPFSCNEESAVLLRSDGSKVALLLEVQSDTAPPEAAGAKSVRLKVLKLSRMSG
jgi:hypothetical protein